MPEEFATPHFLGLRPLPDCGPFDIHVMVVGVWMYRRIAQLDNRLRVPIKRDELLRRLLWISVVTLIYPVEPPLVIWRGAEKARPRLWCADDCSIDRIDQNFA